MTRTVPTKVLPAASVPATAPVVQAPAPVVQAPVPVVQAPVPVVQAHAPVAVKTGLEEADCSRTIIQAGCIISVEKTPEPAAGHVEALKKLPVAKKAAPGLWNRS